MKPTPIILSLLLAACTASPAPGSSFPQLTPPPAGLNMQSTSAEIQKAMLENARQWTTLNLEGMVTWFAEDGAPSIVVQETVWLDPLNSRFRVEMTGMQGSSERTLGFSDGAAVYRVNLASGGVESSALPEQARVGQYVPSTAAGQVNPNPLWGQIGTPLSQLAFPSDYAQNAGLFTPRGIEPVAGREALVVEWRLSPESAPAWTLWLDTSTALILRLQQFRKGGGTAVESERLVTSLVIDPSVGADLFALPAGLAGASPAQPTDSAPAVTESAPPSPGEAGELYFFLQPRGSGSGIQLARVAGACVYDPAGCPPMEIVPVPFPFSFTINALSWSPDGRFAAFSYSDQPAGTPTKLWLFDPADGAWTSLAEFPYIDPPFWSPDGAWIAFRTQDGQGGEDVHLIRRDGSGLKSVSSGLPPEGRPYIMDGWYTENILMRPALPSGPGMVYLVRAADGAARPLFASTPTKAQYHPAPDASLLAYDEYDPASGTHRLKVMEPDGANAATLAEFSGGSIYPIVWSPDSRWLAFNHFGSFTSGAPSAEVFLVGRDGSRRTSVYQGVTVGRLVFSADGRFLVAEETTSVSGGHLFVIDLATLEKKLLQAPGLSTDFDWYAPSWRP